jgi:transcriptional regulator with XRE-family HTH domain
MSLSEVCVEDVINELQCRAARAILNWTQDELARQAGVSNVTVRCFETEQRKPIRATLAAIQRAFEDAGVEFDADGRGARLARKPQKRR